MDKSLKNRSTMPSPNPLKYHHLVDRAKKEKQQKDLPKIIIAWIKSHPMFKWGVMCKDVGIDKANFSRTMANPNPVISPEILLKIVSVISEYGFGGK